MSFQACFIQKLWIIFRHILSLVQVLVHKTTRQFSTTILRSLGIITQPSRGSWPPGWEPVPSVMMCEAFVALSRLPQNSDEGRFFFFFFYPGDVGSAPPDRISEKLPPYCTWWGSTGRACDSWIRARDLAKTWARRSRKVSSWFIYEAVSIWSTYLMKLSFSLVQPSSALCLVVSFWFT